MKSLAMNRSTALTRSIKRVRAIKGNLSRELSNLKLEAKDIGDNERVRNLEDTQKELQKHKAEPQNTSPHYIEVFNPYT